MTDEVSGAQRDDAVAVLRRHWQAGTLDASDHERRTALVRRARTPADLDEAMRGLPPAVDEDGRGRLIVGPDVSGGAHPAPRPTPGPARGPAHGREVAGPEDRTGGLVKLPKNVAATLSALLPLLCVFAVFALGAQWWVFLLIPIVGIVVYGPDGKDGDKDGDKGGDDGDDTDADSSGRR